MSQTNLPGSTPYGAPPGSQTPASQAPPSQAPPSPAPPSQAPEPPGVQERLGEAASRVGDAGRETARDARERVHDVAHEAGDQARGLADRATTELRSRMSDQQRNLAGGLRSLGDELGRMAGAAEDPGYASDLVDRAGQATGRVARWFEDREPDDVLHEVEAFARRRPGTFVLIAAGAGLLAGRLLRGSRDGSADDDPDAGRAPVAEPVDTGGETYAGRT
ncbi:hypothetical protein ACIG47_23185 [Promicromonospora sp. NPDC052451]|uniref:hypothetical protein n=1 Tax=Promicromonospora sp. NPDC052451 TaxID=3364407 RepID=UPI0037C94D30